MARSKTSKVSWLPPSATSPWVNELNEKHKDQMFFFPEFLKKSLDNYWSFQSLCLFLSCFVNSCHPVTLSLEPRFVNIYKLFFFCILFWGYHGFVATWTILWWLVTMRCQNCVFTPKENPFVLKQLSVWCLKTAVYKSAGRQPPGVPKSEFSDAPTNSRTWQHALVGFLYEWVSMLNTGTWN